MCSDWYAAAQGCAIFSATGVLFLSLIGTLLIRQPFFITGLEDDVDVMKGSAFGAAGTFFFCFLISMFYVLNTGRQTIASTGRGHIERFGEYSQVGGGGALGMEPTFYEPELRVGEYS